MTVETPVKEWLNRFKVPPQDLDNLSFCANQPAKVGAWARGLPLTRISYVSSLLYKALPEVARLKTGPETRLAMLEALRPAVQQTIQGLVPQFLNQPLILPELAHKTATVAQALQKHLTHGYLVVLLELAEKPHATEGEAGRARKALTLHRAITGLGLRLLRSFQLYTPVPRQLWLELHSLYQLGEHWQVQHLPVVEELGQDEHTSSLECQYLRLLLLSCARPNQLRQVEVSATYDALEKLAPLARLEPYGSAQKDNLFAVLLDNDSPPLYKSRLPSIPGGEIRELATGPVVKALEQERKARGVAAPASRDAFGLTTALSEHLSQSWYLLAQRRFERQPGQGEMELTIGLTNLHYHLSGGQPFSLFMNQASQVHEEAAGPFSDKPPKGEPLSLEPDAWGEAFDAGGSRLAGDDVTTFNIESRIREQEQKAYRGSHPIYKVPILDSSLGGYCLEWRERVPVQLKAGEVLGLREAGRHKWSVGVVRWVQQARAVTLIGVQILAPQAIPLGTAVIHKAGDRSEFLRALEIPPLKAVNQPATLLTNAVTFHEYSKIRLYRRNSGQREENHKTQRRVQLTRRRFATGVISQFEYRELGADQEPPESRRST